jgi:membrane protease YdiL (CAAX protease family)
LYHGDALAPVTAVKVVGAAILTIYAIQLGLHAIGVQELVGAAAAFLAVAVGVVWWARWSGITGAQLGLRRPALVHVAAGVLVGLSAWYVNLWLVSLIQPPGDSSALEAVVVRTSLLPTVVALAILPAVAEELVFRGVLARALETTFVRGYAIALSAAAFAIYHLLPAQMITTFCLGLVLAYITLRAHSVIPAMIAHLLNNVIALLVSRNDVPTGWMTAQPVAMLVGSALVLVSGIALAASKGAA